VARKFVKENAMPKIGGYLKSIVLIQEVPAVYAVEMCGDDGRVYTAAKWYEYFELGHRFIFYSDNRGRIESCLPEEHADIFD
jgi:hypothetical protein